MTVSDVGAEFDITSHRRAFNKDRQTFHCKPVFGQWCNGGEGCCHSIRVQTAEWRPFVHFKSAFTPVKRAFSTLVFLTNSLCLWPSVKLIMSNSLYLSLSRSLSLEVNYSRGRFQMQNCSLELCKGELERRNWLDVRLRSRGMWCDVLAKGSVAMLGLVSFYQTFLLYDTVVAVGHSPNLTVKCPARCQLCPHSVGVRRRPHEYVNNNGIRLPPLLLPLNTLRRQTVWRRTGQEGPRGLPYMTS